MIRHAQTLTHDNKYGAPVGDLEHGKDKGKGDREQRGRGNETGTRVYGAERSGETGNGE